MLQSVQRKWQLPVAEIAVPLVKLASTPLTAMSSLPVQVIGSSPLHTSADTSALCLPQRENPNAPPPSETKSTTATHTIHEIRCAAFAAEMCA